MILLAYSNDIKCVHIIYCIIYCIVLESVIVSFEKREHFSKAGMTKFSADFLSTCKVCEL